jgi:hypothetical protein
VGRLDDLPEPGVKLLRRGYGSGPVHLVAHLAALALCAYAMLQLLDAGRWFNVVLWLVGAVILHDLVLLPLYTGLDRAARRVAGPRGINFLRVPAGLSALLALVYFPLILNRSDSTYTGLSGLQADGHLERWLLVSGALFAASALLFLLTARKAS